MLNLVDKFLTSINKTLNLISETRNINFDKLLEFSLEDFDINEIEPTSISEDDNGNIIEYTYFDSIHNFENVQTFIDLIEDDNKQLLTNKELTIDDCKNLFYKLKFLNQNCFEKNVIISPENKLLYEKICKSPETYDSLVNIYYYLVNFCGVIFEHGYEDNEMFISIVSLYNILGIKFYETEELRYKKMDLHQFVLLGNTGLEPDLFKY